MSFVTTSKERAITLSPKETEVLFNDDFTYGLTGWGGLIDSGQPNFYPYVAPVTMTGNHSMVLDTQGGSTSAAASAIKRLGLREKKIMWHSKIAWTGDNNNFLRYINFAMDVEDSSYRYWYDMRYEHFNESSAEMSPKFEFNTGTASAQSFSASSVTYEIRYNQEQKTNFDDITLVIDLESKKYESLTINGVKHAIDLAPEQSPKLANPDTYFTNGMNFLFTVTGRSNNSSSDPRLYIDQTQAVVL